MSKRAYTTKEIIDRAFKSELEWRMDLALKEREEREEV